MPGSADKYLIFRIAEEFLALPLAAVRELLPVAAVTRPPDAPAWLHGFLRLGSETLPVVALAPLLGFPQSPLSLQAHFIRPDRGPLWYVDRVEQIVESPALAPLPADHFINNYATGSFQNAGVDVIVLRPESLLLAEERQRIEQLTNREQARRQAAGVGADA